MAGSDLPELEKSLTEEILNTVDAPTMLLSPEGEIVRFNIACERLTRYAASEAVGRKVWDFLIVDEEIDAARAAFEQSRAKETPTHFVNTWKDKDGRLHPVEWSNKRICGLDGAVQYILASGHDLTDRRSREAALSESRAFLRSVIDASPVAIITMNERRQILTFSKQAEIAFGHKESEVIGKNINILMPEPDRTHHDDYVKRYLETGEKRIIGTARPIMAQRRSGEAFPAVLHVSEFHHSERIFVGFVEDMSEQKAVERRLAETQTQLQHAGRLGAMGEIATSIAHELNQPLTAAASLAGAVALTLKKSEDERSAEAAGLLDDAIGEVRRASEIIRQMRAFVRKGKTARSLHDVNKVVEDAATIALVGADSYGVEVIKNFDKDIGAAQLDRLQIQQVVTNLILNAVDAMKGAPERRLTIATAKRDGEIEVSVEDTGPGIDEEAKKRLFEPFFTTKDEGTGIGLSISKSIIDAHQGALFVNDGNFKGCKFVFRLPVTGA